MTKRRIILLNMMNVLVFGLLALTFYSGSRAIENIKENQSNLRYSIEQHWRANSRQILKDSINIFEGDVEKGVVDPNNMRSVGEWATLNFSGIRNGGPTSDGWVGEIGNAIFIDDQSPDCQVELIDGVVRTFDQEPQMHEDPALAKEIMDRILVGVPTTHGDSYYWNFDGSPEWIEFTYYPEKIGVHDEPRTINGIKNPKYIQYVFFMGAQQDEIFKRYEDIFKTQEDTIQLLYIVMVGSFTMSVLFLLSVIFIKPFKKRRCE